MKPLTSITIYETPIHFYVIGTDASETSFSTLKIDRSSGSEFVVGEPDHEYSKADIDELLSTISSSSIVTEVGNSRRNVGAGLIRTIYKAYGLLGAIKFLEGYYLLVVTKASIVTMIGHHAIYKVEDVSMIYIPTTGQSINADEQRYAKLFQTIDVTTNFYFSYTYDLSRNLQENVLMARNVKWNKNTYSEKTPPEVKFVWNNYLLKPFVDNGVRSKWTLKIVHGYVGYQIVELPCTKLTIALIARRSAAFAGTRFLKRGCNFDGAVANDVETEQIVWDMNSDSSLKTGHFTGFVQRRGSVPLFWSQDPSTRGTVVGKPPIYVDLVEPNALTTAKHFRELRRKYNHPVLVINLVKRRERRQECLLHEQLLKTVRYLNEFRKPGRKIDYISFDVAKCNKRGQVIAKLEQLGLKTVLKNGWFQSFPRFMAHKIRPHPLLENYEPLYNEDESLILQSGISRTNCVDCLDRTNVAQYGIGKVALGFQLYAMGYVSDPIIPATGELCRLFEENFDEHGDTIAWQYAGSQLVHTIKTYKKISAFQERSRDVIQTISRYYSNTFNDYEKQNGINLFLGIFRPFQKGSLPNLWDISSDRYLHFPINLIRKNEYLQWATNVTSDSEDSADEEWLKDWLQVKADEAEIQIDNDFALPDKKQEKRSFRSQNEERDAFDYVYRTFELTSFDQLLREQEKFNKKVLQLDALNEVVGQSTTFMKLFKTNDPLYTSGNMQALTAQNSVDNDDNDEEEYDTLDDDTSVEEDLKCEEEQNGPFGFPSQPLARTISPIQHQTRLDLNTGLKSSLEVYGFDWDRSLCEADMNKYRKYVQLAQQNSETKQQQNDGSLQSFSKLEPIFEFTRSFYTVDNVFNTELDEIPSSSIQIYIDTVKNGNFEPLPQARQLYAQFQN